MSDIYTENSVSNASDDKSGAGKRTYPLQVVVNRKEKEEIEERAREAHLSVSAYLRKCALEMPQAEFSAFTKR